MMTAERMIAMTVFLFHVILRGMTLRNGVVSAGIAGMTATDSPDRQPRSLKKAVGLQGLDGIAGTGWIKPASTG
jgi:energy-converting hydrogenase Eha subunit G